jgi:hypothetical protein
MTVEDIKTINRRYETVGWGLLAIIWGFTILFDFIPFSAGLVGTGLLLLGVNVVRSLNGLPTRSDNTILGILALVWGGLELVGPILHLPFVLSDWAIFAILLIALGMTLLVGGLLRTRRQV